MHALVSIILLSVVGMVSAELPSEYELTCTKIEIVRDAIDTYTKYDYDTNRRFHPFLRESINSILACSKSDLMLERVAGYNDTTAVYYFNLLKDNGITLYRVRKLQGRVMRLLLHKGYPLLVLGGHVVPKRNVYRVFGDVVYMYRKPDYTQSSKKEPGELYYTFISAKGYKWEVKELYRPTSGGGRHVDDFYIMTTETITLKKIKQDLNDGLSDVGFEYHLPEFKKISKNAFNWYAK